MNNKIALTISPKDRLYGEYAYLLSNKILNPLRIIYRNDIEIIRRALNRCSQEYVIYPELDVSGRLHYHGIVNIKHKKNWMISSLPALKKLGFVCVKNNVNEGWTQYITKDWNDTKVFLDIDEPIVYRKLRPGPKIELLEEIKKSKTILDYLASEAA